MKTKSGKQLFPIGIGTWNISSEFQPGHPDAKYKGTETVYGNEEAEIEGLKYSFSKGQNHIDCAELYGAFYTDEVVGKAIAGLERTDLYIADKLWRTSLEDELVTPTVESMLEKLGTDYLDMLYIHAPFDDADWRKAIPQIDKLIDDGIVREFGVSNFTIEQMKEAQVIAKHPIVANQMNYNVLYKDEVNDEFRRFCKEQGIQLVAYQPVKRQEVLSDSTIQQIAAQHDATPAQIALAWLLAKDALPIPKSINMKHIDENMTSVDIKLNADELVRLDRL